MTFKELATGAFYLPARIFSGITGLLLGEDYVNSKGKKAVFNGLFGVTVDAVKFVLNVLLGAVQYIANSLLNAAKYLVRGISNFIGNHQKAIAVAFWSSLVVAGAAALTVALWPAALAAVTGFTIGGISIASLVGTGFAAQVAATGGVAAIATSAVVFTGAAIVNTLTGIRDFFVNRRNAKADKRELTSSSILEEHEINRPFAGLNNKNDKTEAKKCSSNDDYAPSIYSSPLATRAKDTDVSEHTSTAAPACP
jgi:hypothetical protein